MAGLADLEDRIAKLEAAAAEIREATRDAHAATKELRRAEKAVRDLLGSEVRDLVDEAITQQVSDGLERFVADTVAARDQAVRRIESEFDKLAEIFIKGGGLSQQHILAEAHRAREKRRADGAEATAAINGRPIL